MPNARRGPVPGKAGHGATRASAADLDALRRGRVSVDATLDLHGLTAEAARGRLREFIDDASAEGLCCVRIVHGKGLRSGPGGPVLKTLVERELHANQGVAAFVPARPADGGSGATVALLSLARARRRLERR
jgi:DNA-nicking Smr family endonuclease